MAAPKIESSTTTTVSNRWLIPLGAVLVHICIGSVYAWSTFNRPIDALFPNSPAWLRTPYIDFTPAIVLLGLSAAFGGPWVEKRGPRVAAAVAAVFFGVGLAIAGLGLLARQPLVVFLGMGVVAGIGCGLGYIAPVSTLVKWFPDRRGMATGMAIMGFGGGAAVASPMNVGLMKALGSPTDAARGVGMTMIALGAIYLVVMFIGSRILQRAPVGYRPAGWVPQTSKNKMISDHSLSRNQAVSKPQFFLLWGILFINVSAGIGILSQASPMTQDMFSKSVTEAGAVVSLISLFNLAGRFIWASGSDYIGRRNTYAIFFIVQVFLFLLIPYLAAAGNYLVFLVSWSIIYTMYGGGFSTIPAFLADIFGPENVGAIHGAILTAWSAAAVVGPLIITQLSNSAKAALAPGASRVHIYDAPLEVLAAGLAVGLVLTLLVRPLKRAH